MNRKRPTSQRVFRELTPQEQSNLQRARAETEAARDEILAEGLLRKQAWQSTHQEVAKAVSALRAMREQQGLSLADVEARSGLKRSALSRLENDPNANPTILTLQRYALAIGVKLTATIEPSHS